MGELLHAKLEVVSSSLTSGINYIMLDNPCDMKYNIISMQERIQRALGYEQAAKASVGGTRKSTEASAPSLCPAICLYLCRSTDILVHDDPTGSDYQVMHWYSIPAHY